MFGRADAPVSVDIKPFSNNILYDPRFMALFSTLVSFVGLIFLFKSTLDYKVAKFSMIRDSYSTEDIGELINIGIIKANVDMYIWLVILDAIGDTYKTYSDALDVVSGRDPNFSTIHLSVSYNIDLDELEKSPELADFIKSRRKFKEEVLSHLDKDHSNFKCLVKPIIEQPRLIPLSQVGQYVV